MRAGFPTGYREVFQLVLRLASPHKTCLHHSSPDVATPPRRLLWSIVPYPCQPPLPYRVSTIRYRWLDQHFQQCRPDLNRLCQCDAQLLSWHHLSGQFRESGNPTEAAALQLSHCTINLVICQNYRSKKSLVWPPPLRE